MIKETLCSFENDSKDSFFNAILYGFLFKLSKDNKKDKEKVEEVLGKSFFDDFQKRNKILQLDHSFDDFEKKCIANEHLVKKVTIHNKFRYIIKKGVQGKNKNIQDL